MNFQTLVFVLILISIIEFLIYQAYKQISINNDICEEDKPKLIKKFKLIFHGSLLASFFIILSLFYIPSLNFNTLKDNKYIGETEILSENIQKPVFKDVNDTKLEDSRKILQKSLK